MCIKTQILTIIFNPRKLDDFTHLEEGNTQKHGTFPKRTVVIESSDTPIKTLHREGRLSPLAKLGRL